jgi:hypothetical protein
MPTLPLIGGEGHTRWRERGWESPNSDEGTYTVVLCICTYFVVTTILRNNDALLSSNRLYFSSFRW